MQNSEAEDPSPSPPWLELPADITADILCRLGTEEILETAQKVCTYWWRVCKDPSIWRVIDLSYPRYLPRDAYPIGIMCRHAVDRSQGQLIDVNLGDFATDELLLYISQRCNLLKRLRLEDCGASRKGLTEAVKSFPELEELRFFVTVLQITSEDIENIGTSCPKLKSFSCFASESFNLPLRMDGLDLDSNRNALAVAKTMPNLHHLELSGDEMNNEALEAILNSCPHLESLDIDRCLDIDLSGDLGKRCLQQLKVLRPPYYVSEYDSDDYYGGFYSD